MITGDVKIPDTKDIVTHAFGNAVQRIVIFDKLPIDEVLTYQSKMVGFLLVTGTALSDIAFDPVPREVKDILRG